MRWRRLIAGAGVTLLAGMGLAAVATTGFVVWVGTPSGNAWLGRTLTRAVSATMTEGAFEIDGLRTDLLYNLEIDGLRIVDGQGSALVELDHARARLNTPSLLTGPLRVHRLEGVGLSVILDAGPDGRMKLASLWGPPSTEPSTEPFSLPIDLAIDEVLLEGVGVRKDASLRLSGGVARGTVNSAGPRFDLTGLGICGHLVAPGPTAVCLEGPVLWDGSAATLTGLAVELPGTAIAVQGSAGGEALDLSLAIGDLDLGALDPVASNAGIAGTWGGALTVRGPLEELVLAGNLAGTGESAGTLGIDGYARIGDAIAWGGKVRANAFHVEDIYPGVGDPLVLDGLLGLDATGISFPDDLDLGITYQGEADIFEAYETDELDVVARLKDGTVTLSRTSFLGIAGRLNATGTIDAEAGPLDLVVTGQVIPAEIAELGIEGLGGSGTANVRITGDIKKDPGAFAVAGQVVMAPFTYTEDVRFERLVVDLAGTTKGGDFTFAIDATGTEGLAYGVALDTLRAEGVDVRSRDKDLTASGPAQVERVAYADLGVFETAAATWSVSLPAEGEMGVEAAVDLGAFDLSTFLGTGGHADVRMQGDQVAFVVALDDGERAFLRTDGRFDLAAGRLEADALAVSPTPRLAWTSAGPLALTVVDGGVADATIDLRGLHGDVAVSGDLGTTGLLDGRVRVANFQLDALAEMFPEQFPGVSGVLALDATLTGPASAPTIVGETDLLGFWMEGVTRWLDVQGTFDARDGAVLTDLQIGSAGAPLAVLRGRIPLVLDLAAPGPDPRGQVDATLALRPGALERLEHVTVDPLGLPDGRISGVVALSGRLGNPDLRVAGIVETPLGAWEQPARVELDVRRSGLGIDGWATVSEGLSERARVAGGGTTRLAEVFAWALEGGPEPDLSDLEVYLDHMAVSAVLTGMPVDSVARAVGAPVDADGVLVGSVTASGSPWTPTLDGGVHWLEGRLGALPLDSAYVTAVPEQGGLALDAALTFEGGGIAVSGALPIAIDLREESSTWAAGDLDLKVSGEGAPLTLLQLVDPEIRDASGTLALNGTIGGTFAEPVPDLQATLTDGALSYAPAGLRLTGMNGEVGTSKRRVKVSSFVARTEPLNNIGLIDQGRSEIRITGAANLEVGKASELSARITLDDAWVVGTYDYGARLRGDLIVSGALPNLVIRSQDDLVLVQGRVSYDSAKALAAGALEPNRNLTIHRGQVSTRAETDEEPPFYAGFDVDVGLDLNRNLEVLAQMPFFDELGAVTANLTRVNIGARLGGNLDVALDSLGNPLLAGEVDVVDGSVQVLRTTFSLDEGRLVFLGDDIGTTQLDLAANTAVQGTPVELRISGTVDQPEISTTSPGFDQTQVMLMLITGRTAGSVAGDEGRAASGEVEALATTAAALVASSVLSGTSAGALTIEPDGAVRVGAPWSASVFTQLVIRPFADPDENRFSGSLDWSLARRLVLELGAGDRYQWSDLSWEIRF